MSRIFHNRAEAGIMLAEKPQKFKSENGIVLAVPRGGVPVAYYVARELDFPVQIVLTKKIGHPANKEYAIGAASLTDYFVAHHEDVSDEYISDEVERIRDRLKNMYRMFIGKEQPKDVAGKTVIIVDDGIATGNTLLATVQLLRKKKPHKIIIAVPVASVNAFNKLKNEVDEVIALEVPEIFYGVGSFYEDFKQVSDEDVMFYLSRLRELNGAV